MATDIPRAIPGDGSDRHTQRLVRKVTFSYVRMTFYGVGITIAAVLSAWGFNHWHPLPRIGVNLLEYTGYICWSATLGMLGQQAWGGNSLVEKFDQKLTRIFSLIGIFAFVMAKELIPMA